MERPAPGGQEAVVATEAELLLVSGGPGAGKTRTALLLARRLLDDQPQGRARRVLFLTFSRSAVSELLERAPTLLTRDVAQSIEVATFHSFAHGLINAFGRYVGLGVDPVAVASEAERALNVAPAGALTYDDLVPAAVDILERAPWIREAVAGRYVAVICDEYQDTGNDQDQLLRILAGGRRLVCLADGDQMIYDFRPDVGPRRLAGLRALGPVEIPLEPVSHRDPTGVMPALAAAIRDRRLGDDVVADAIASGRLRIRTVDDPWEGAVEEARALRRAGHGTVGVFVSKREYVEELARVFASASIQHEIAGLDAAAGEAQAVIATMAACAAGSATFASVRERIAVFLAAAQPRRNPPAIAISLISAPETLPGPIQRRLEALEGALHDLEGEPVANLFRVASDALSIYGWGQSLWRLGVRDLYGQALDLVRRPLNATSATALANIAARRRSDALTTDLGSLRMPVRLMTMHQAKGREMDAILIVHHADDYIPDLDKFGRVMFVAASRARQVVSIQLNPTPLPAYAGLAALEESPEF